ncbi:MAG: class I SAM-dependent methyltransferase [Candidatus Binatia bacterium]
MRPANVGHYILGAEGLALLRHWLNGDREQARARVDDLTRFLTRPGQPPISVELDVPETDVLDGYARWAGTYDDAPNALINAEQPVMQAMLDAIPPARALDAACGTGRLTTYLAARGHRVIGVDTSDAMLQRARAKLPQVDFRVGDLAALPVETGSMDLAVCALALTHCADLQPPIRELARVLRPGGRLLLSDLHPALSALGMTAFFVGADGGAGYVRSYYHPISTYLTAFASAGLDVRRCIEPPIGEEEVPLMSGGMMHLAGDAFRAAFLGLPEALIWELVRR